jgi:N-methylhydantoinase A/oxoprolinase/acetone carboxylase beta subunit
MGGTSLDVAILDGAEPPFASAPRVSGIELALPMIQTTSIGAGGGSIARLVEGRVQVGPESAGSAPGPACYDKGGLEPTVTDANLVLGFLDADRFLNGRMRLNRKRAEDALTRRLARPLGASLEEVASTVRAGIDGRMAADIAARIRDHGLEPAEVVLFAFGGGGPLHGCAIAQQIGIRRVIGFPFGSVFSAFGSSTADVRHLYYRPLSDGAAAEDGAATALETLRQQAAVDMRGEGFADGAVTLTDRVESRPSEPRTLVLDARAPVPHWLPSPAQAAGASRPEAHERRAVRWSAEDLAETPLYRLDDLVHGAVFDGPALVEAPDTSYAVPRGWTARLDAWGNLTMERAR